MHHYWEDDTQNNLVPAEVAAYMSDKAELSPHLQSPGDIFGPVRAFLPTAISLPEARGARTKPLPYRLYPP